MHSIFYIIGVIVVVLAILSLLGLRMTRRPQHQHRSSHREPSDDRIKTGSGS